MYRAPKKRKSYSQKIDFEISKKTCSFIPSTKKYRNMGPSTMSITFIVLFPEARRYVGRYVPTATLPWFVERPSNHWKWRSKCAMHWLVLACFTSLRWNTFNFLGCNNNRVAMIYSGRSSSSFEVLGIWDNSFCPTTWGQCHKQILA